MSLIGRPLVRLCSRDVILIVVHGKSSLLVGKDPEGRSPSPGQALCVPRHALPCLQTIRRALTRNGNGEAGGPLGTFVKEGLM